MSSFQNTATPTVGTPAKSSRTRIERFQYIKSGAPFFHHSGTKTGTASRFLLQRARSASSPTVRFARHVCRRGSIDTRINACRTWVFPPLRSLARGSTMRWFISAFAFAFSSMMAIADGLPPSVQRAVAEQRRDCKTFAFDKGFVTRKDIDGDRWALCGSLGCLTQVFASLPDGTYAKVVDETVRRLTFRQVQGRPAIVLGLAGDADPCRRTRVNFAR
jgi:hypothetical protein